MPPRSVKSVLEEVQGPLKGARGKVELPSAGEQLGLGFADIVRLGGFDGVLFGRIQEKK